MASTLARPHLRVGGHFCSVFFPNECGTALRAASFDAITDAGFSAVDLAYGGVNCHPEGETYYFDWLGDEPPSGDLVEALRAKIEAMSP
jgi:hypothetical protein